MSEKHTLAFQLAPQDQTRLGELVGQLNAHLRLIEEQLHVQIGNRGHLFQVEGDEGRCAQARFVIENLYAQTGSGVLNADDVHLGPGFADQLIETLPQQGTGTVQTGRIDQHKLPRVTSDDASHRMPSGLGF